jgi:hypothetical protein
MGSYLSLALKTHGDARLEALGRGEHVHADFIETLVEEIQLTMQGYKTPVWPSKVAKTGVVKPRVARSTVVKSMVGLGRQPPRNKWVKRQVVVQDGGEVAATSRSRGTRTRTRRRPLR